MILQRFRRTDKTLENVGDVDNPAYKYREDDTGTYLYQGEAEPGTATSDAGWRISRTTLATGAVDWADSGELTQVWDSRTTLTYA